jgi:hypothetical protein
MPTTLIDKRRHDTLDCVLRNYVSEDYSSALENMGTLWALYAMHERIDQMIKCDGVISRLIQYSRSMDNVESVRWRGMANAHRILDSIGKPYTDVDPIIKEISEKWT